MTRAAEELGQLHTELLCFGPQHSVAAVLMCINCALPSTSIMSCGFDALCESASKVLVLEVPDTL